MESILHIGNIAGVPQVLSKAQRKMGLKSDILSFDSNLFEYNIDFYYPTKLPFPLRSVEKIFKFRSISNKYDVFHFHYSSILPFGVDIPIWKIQKKKVIIHHHGSDIRNKEELRMYKKFADKIIVSTPDLLKWSPDAIWVPNPISIEDFSYVGNENKDKSEEINIVHAPSNRAKKGTEHVIKAIERLKSEGYKINFMLIEHMPYNKAIEFYKKADIVIDQLLIGWYGMFAMECMAFGKPVCSYISDNLESYMPFNPIINTSPGNIVENLRILIEDRSLRKEAGDKGRKYIIEMHDANKIAKQLINFYR
ncbi:Uncharacterised protein [uncultured archaeon]|nr:Uncharacterised protein [uncultured archaeon]